MAENMSVEVEETTVTPITDSSTASTTVTNKKRDIASRSEYWKSFKKFTKGTDTMARCLHCKREIRANSQNGTAPLKNHLLACKAKHISDSTQPELVGMGLHGEKFLVPYKYDYEAVRKALTMMIILDELPFKFVMGLGFRLFMEAACPRFPIPSRWTVQRDCYQMFVGEKEKMRDFFKKSGQRVCLTTDTWTSLQKVNYMCVTAHFIDERWTMNKRLLAFTPIFSHKGKDIGIALELCLRDWGIDKVFTITVDNASANDVAITYVRDKLKNKSFADGKFFHLRCVAHILHLIVTDGLHLCEAAVSKVRLAVKYVKSSSGRYALFKSAIALEDIQYKGWLSLDVKTRWNSTYKMLDAAHKFQKAFERFEDMDPLFKFTLRDDDNNSLVPTYEDWEKVKKLVAILRRFYNLTLKVSGYKSVSSHSFFDDAANLHIIFQQWKDGDDFSLTNMALPMCEKYEKYWGEDKMNLLFYIAVGLDPRKKLRFLRFTLTDMYGRHKGDTLFEKVNKALYDLFDEYKCKFGPSLLTPSSSIDSFRTSNVNSDGDEDDDERMTTQRITRFKIQELGVGENNKSELDKYLGEDLEDDSEEFDILSWWKILSSRFPILGHMARDVLAVPVSTVASEATFSTGGRILDAFRSSLSARTVQSLLCAQDWLRGQSSQINFEEDHDEMEALEDGFSSMGIDVYNKYID